ncbi:MAG: pyridoxal-phosphate dependent enzyme [Candidatus Thermoplasmatota archaeon]|nr:pyridoxal-phosphate dependent enzyme [Candidatus Thermoplasmatota archaeon]
MSGDIVHPTLEHIRAAHDRIRPHVHRTPVMTSGSIDSISGSSIFFKCENLQKVGAFKARGAVNAVMSLNENGAKKGVATHSSGNHAQALAYAASLRGIPCHIVMPRNAPLVKVEAVRGYGARIVFCEPTLAAREEALEEVVSRTKAAFIPPYDDPRIVAGQATAAIELFEDVQDLDAVMTPVGGGGLLSGTCLAAKYTSKRVAVIAAEPSGADDAYRSLARGRIVPSEDPNTICDGLLTSLGKLNFDIISRSVSRIVRVEDASTIKAMRLIMERLKIVVEPSACVTLGALLEGQEDLLGKRIGIILSGGNVDLSKLPWNDPR